MTATEELSQLRAAVRNDPLNAQLRYLLGAELAECGEHEQATIELTTAVELQPALHTARFQLGLLHLTLARPSESLSTWAPLDALAEDEPLRIFKQGLEALIRNDLQGCIDLLEHGIALNSTNTPLNRDMAMVVERARTALQNPPGTSDTPASAEQPGAIRTDFSLYGGQTRQ